MAYWPGPNGLFPSPHDRAIVEGVLRRCGGAEVGVGGQPKRRLGAGALALTAVLIGLAGTSAFLRSPAGRSPIRLRSSAFLHLRRRHVRLRHRHAYVPPPPPPPVYQAPPSGPTAAQVLAAQRAAARAKAAQQKAKRLRKQQRAVRRQRAAVARAAEARERAAARRLARAHGAFAAGGKDVATNGAMPFVAALTLVALFDFGSGLYQSTSCLDTGPAGRRARGPPRPLHPRRGHGPHLFRGLLCAEFRELIANDPAAHIPRAPRCTGDPVGAAKVGPELPRSRPSPSATSRSRRATPGPRPPRSRSRSRSRARTR